MARTWRQATSDDESRITRSLAGLAAVLLVVVLSLVVIRKLQVRCLLETCLTSGQPGCEESVARLRVSKLFERFELTAFGTFALRQDRRRVP